MDFAPQYCLKKLQQDYFNFAIQYKLCLAHYGKSATVTQTTLKNTKDGVRIFLELRGILRKYELYRDILSRIKSARIGMNHEAIMKQLLRVDNLFKYKDDFGN
jgi:hypothetical protein